MSGIKRYDEGGYGLSNMEEAAEGSWVDYDSHLMVVMGQEQMLNDKISELQQKLDAVVADQKRYDFLAQFFDVDMWDADDYHCVRGLCFNEPKFDRVTIGLPYDMSLEDAIDEHLKRADAAKGGSDD